MEAWQIGPVIKGRNSSPGMGTSFGDNFWFLPVGRGSMHYATRRMDGPISGTIRLTYQIETSPDAVFIASDGATPGRIALHFQRRGDTWTARGSYAGYRWWSSNRPLLTPGEHTLSIPLDFAQWIAVTSTGRTQALFDAAKRSAYRIGFTFGGSGNAGHGVAMKSGHARFWVKSFAVG